ncbi:SDR family NAD(P)-dependent oxidoreductase [Sulfobacillus harzensis]|uniref:SDR family oxidoreductase n=1 Tax=Sulfobacillus harzensis TaxID=2729629 RepID=A0A7Y0Q2V6_9FIRM|nr:SDR family oxidoreductase [Sulfobacillus harzensis]NMP22760.1 SDR family oxidoreductase [Sulfobacillus harzensis]
MRVQYDFRDSVVVVTGGGHGIGAGLCRAVASAGGTAVSCDIAPDPTLEGFHGSGRIIVEKLDVGDREGLQGFLKGAIDTYGKIDAFVQAAAIQPRQDIEEIPPETWLRIMDVNLNSLFYAAQVLMPHMKARKRGSFVAFASGLAQTGWARASGYATTKAGVIALIKSIAKEGLPYGVRANVIAPGITDTDLFTGPNNEEEQEFFRVRGGGVGTVDEVVPLLMFLISDASASLTGALLSRDLIIHPTASE